MSSPREKWNRIHRAGAEAPAAAAVLLSNLHLLPAQGDALDLACGLGGNALLLAGRGLRTSAWDISDVALRLLAGHARRLGLPVRTERRDVETEPFPHDAFDVVTVSRFLARPLANAIVASLRPGGLLFYQTFTRAKCSATGPSNPDFLLRENELPVLFADLRLRYYREDHRCGDLALGLRDEACYVGQKD